MKGEVLAPAGSMEAVYAAVRSGADAVYLGSKAFNARRNAANFTEEELSSAIKYCHSHGVKVYITLNTLVSDAELKTASQEIQCACRLSADALLLQDAGLVKIAKEIAPGMPLHASTQMSVQSAEGVKFLENLGFSRVVLARELSLREIKEIRKNTSAELEVFVHGALCMSVSGQCLLSAVIGQRSGNRGLCAQPCRLPFGVNGAQGHALSLRDVSVIERLSELEDAGVASFKIEGRMKRPEYVAAAVTACRQSLDGNIESSLRSDLQSVFSRTGFTSGYLDSKLGADMFGTRRKEDVQSAAPVLKRLANLYDKETARIPVSFALTCAEGEEITLAAKAMGKNVFAGSGIKPEKAINRALTEEDLAARISKCGGTQFYADDVYCDVGENLSAPAIVFNALRRDALTQLDAALSEHKQIPCSVYSPAYPAHKISEKKIYIRVRSEKQIPKNLKGISRVIVPLNVSKEAVDFCNKNGAETAAEIPRAFFGNAEKFRSMLRRAKENGVNLACAGTLDGFSLAKEEGMRVSAGFGSNVFNSEALEFFSENGAEDALLSPELTLRQISSLGSSLKRGVFAYGYLPLMLTRNCPVKTRLDCKECGGKSHLTDRMGIDFPVVCGNGCSELLNSRPVYLADRLSEIKNADYILLYFTTETAEEIENIISAYKNGGKPQGEFTRGLYYRGVE